MSICCLCHSEPRHNEDHLLGLQVMALQQRGIKAQFLGSAQADYSVQNRARDGEFSHLYITPEKAMMLPVR
jgi:superfamily II DNA helicase RecQ